MKKTIGLCIILLLMMTTYAVAEPVNDVSGTMEGVASGAKTADALILTGPGWVRGLTITPDGTNACKVELYDNTSAAGTKVLIHNVGAGIADTAGQIPPFWIPVTTGIYADMTIAAGACTFIVYYVAKYPDR